MSQSTLRQCPVKGCNRLCLTFNGDIPKDFWLARQGRQGRFPEFYFFNEKFETETCMQGVFNMNHKQVFCDLCDSNDGKVFSRGLESSCLTIEEVVAKYGQENRQDENYMNNLLLICFIIYPKILIKSIITIIDYILKKLINIKYFSILTKH